MVRLLCPWLKIGMIAILQVVSLIWCAQWTPRMRMFRFLLEIGLLQCIRLSLKKLNERNHQYANRSPVRWHCRAGGLLMRYYIICVQQGVCVMCRAFLWHILRRLAVAIFFSTNTRFAMCECVCVCLCVWVSVCLCSYGNVRVYGYVYVFLGALWVTSSSNLHLLWQMNWVATKKWQMTWQNGKLAAATEAQAAKPQ